MLIECPKHAEIKEKLSGLIDDGHDDVISSDDDGL